MGAGETKAAVFVAAMVAGMAIFEVIERNRARERKYFLLISLPSL
jgi:uncharacterized protein